MMWDAEKQHHFDRLRQRALTETLSGEEARELEEMLAALEAVEQSYLAPALARMDVDLHQREEQLTMLQTRNEELALLAQQHAQLLSEAKKWLDSFEQRRLILQDRYTRLTQPFVPSKARG
ncbi:MAG: hypothetical protein EI684_01475 [Candidatus Viridilinea halotolerans]|uniref:Uncharacterized protein n=1 Tax=Candidatus Viridilinea halotolerans TaxID=2491704 RepID=A0A426UA77_9CHLR|nr:MAG: hypothetical protein EI684_01475 [Candidatus Viridilinea halotolerans]